MRGASVDHNAAGFELVPLAHVSIGGGERYDTGTGPFGRRVIVGIATGRWDGGRLSGDIIGPGGDWAIPAAGDVMLLDARPGSGRRVSRPASKQ
jgi:hypothetical protein